MLNLFSIKQLILIRRKVYEFLKGIWLKSFGRNKNSDVRSWVLTLGIHSIVIALLFLSFSGDEPDVEEQSAQPIYSYVISVQTNSDINLDDPVKSDSNDTVITPVVDKPIDPGSETTNATAPPNIETESPTIIQTGPDPDSISSNTVPPVDATTDISDISESDNQDVVKSAPNNNVDDWLLDKFNSALDDAQSHDSSSKTVIRPTSPEKVEMLERQEELDKYIGLIRDKIYSRWTIPPGTNKQEKVIIELKLLPTGEKDSVVILSDSNEALEQAALVAINSIRYFPIPEDRALFNSHFRSIRLVFAPE